MTFSHGTFRPEFCRRLSLVVIALLAATSLGHESRQDRLSAPAAFSVLSASRKTISIQGDVRYQGIYTVPDNMLTHSAIQMADPLAVINSWEPQAEENTFLAHGSQVSVAIYPSGKAVLQCKQIPASQRMVLGIPLDINSMNTSDFISLPGIGPALAERIIMFRQKNGGFMRVNDLRAIDGIAEKKYNQLKNYF